MPRLTLLTFRLMASNLYAAEGSLTWNANSESDLALAIMYINVS